MTNLRRGAAAALVVLAASAAPAAAQYEPSTSTTQATTTTTRPVTTTTRPPATTTPPTTTPTTIRQPTTTTPESEASTTTTTAPEPAVVRSQPVQVVFTPGEPAQIVAASDVAFDPDDEPTVTLSTTGDDATTVEIEVVASVDENGNLVIDVLVPEDTPESIIVVTIQAVDARGVQRTLVYLFPVAGPSTTTTTASDALSFRPAAGSALPRSWAELKVVPPSEVPEIVRQLQASVPDEATEQAILAELRANPEAQLVVHGGSILASTSIPAAAEESRPFVAGLAVALAGVGLLVLRRRPSFVKGTR